LILASESTRKALDNRDTFLNSEDAIDGTYIKKYISLYEFVA
jgi:hypothetical protein